jgi:hypothetical protein
LWRWVGLVAPIQELLTCKCRCLCAKHNYFKILGKFTG